MAAPRTTLPRLVRRLALSALCLTTPLELGAQSDEAAMDKLLGPIALYPDPLLAQVLTCSTSPDQLKEFNKWLGQQTVTGSDLQKAATDAEFDASFASMALFPEVVSTLATNIDWTKELGTAYLSDQKAVMASVQRLRAQAQTAGTLKSNEQQTVKVEGSGSTQTIIVQPTNPQVVYVPTYDPQVVYAPPPPASSGVSPAVAGLIGFGLGIAIGAAIDNDPYYYGPYGWGAWGMGWGGGGVHYHRSVWVVPARPRYPYARPVPGYRPSTTVVAPRRTNVNINVNNNKVNVGNKVQVGNNTNVNTGNRTNVSKGATVGDRNVNTANPTPNANNRTPNTAKSTAAAGNRTPNAASAPKANATKASATDRGRAAPSASTPKKTESSATAMSGYGSGSSTKAASNRGKASVSKSSGAKSGGGGKRRP